MKNDFRNGFISNIPIGISVFAYGSVLGMLCIQKDVSLLELILMNTLIFAGSAQFVIVEMWSSSLDILSITVTALMVNLRYFLIGASLNPLFVGSTRLEKFKFMHLVADENWAVTINKMKNEPISPSFLFGGGVSILFTWSLGTISGYSLGGFISDPAKFGLDFAFVSIFFALALSMYKGKQNILPWLVTALVAVIVESLIEGKSYIVIGAIAGTLVAVFQEKKESNG